MVLRLPLSPSLSVSSLQRLRSAFVAAIWSRRMPLAHTGGVLTMLDGPASSDLGFHVVWCRFRLYFFKRREEGEAGGVWLMDLLFLA